ncbi:hypothetical protein DFH07DRAFT_942302, partial [Mycena maculata]
MYLKFFPLLTIYCGSAARADDSERLWMPLAPSTGSSANKSLINGSVQRIEDKGAGETIGFICIIDFVQCDQPCLTFGPESATISVPLFAGSGIGTMFDWRTKIVGKYVLEEFNRNSEKFKGADQALDYTSTAQVRTAPNAMIYSRGASDEYDRLADISGDSGWSWNSLEQYGLKNEQHTPPWNSRSNVGEYNPSVHGQGPLLTGLTPTVFEADKRVIQTTVDNGAEYPFNLDFSSGNGLGFGTQSISTLRTQ